MDLQDFFDDVKGIGRPFAWVGAKIGQVPRLSGLGQTTDAVRQPQLEDGTPLDLDADVEQTGAALSEAGEAGKQVIEAAAEALEGRTAKRQNTDTTPVERNAREL